MSTTAPALIAAAAGVGFGHAILPDHWVPLAVVGRTRRYPLWRVARLSGLAGIAHVLVSIVLGALVVAIGLQFRSTVQSAQDDIIGAILILTGLGFVALELTGRGHQHRHDHDHGQTHAHHRDRGSEQSHGEPDAQKRRGLGGMAAIMGPFGAAASPDLTILPVFLAATTAGITTAIGSLLVFATVTIATIVGLTLFACLSGYQVRGRWLERWGNLLTALVLTLIGALVLTGTI